MYQPHPAALILCGLLAAVRIPAHAASEGAGSRPAAENGAPENTSVMRIGDLTVERAYARATPGGAKVASGYLRITNHGTAPDRLLGGTASFAGRVEIHTMRLDEGVMRMRPLPQGVVIEPGQSVELKPGAEHVMFMDLHRPLQAGERSRMTLSFDRAGSLEFEIPVRGMNARGAEAGGAAHHH